MAASALVSLPIGDDGSVVVVVVVVVVSPYSSRRRPLLHVIVITITILTLSRCASLFFDMLGNCVYSSETILNSK